MSASSSTSPRKCETRMTVRPPADRPLTISWKRWISVRRQRSGRLVEDDELGVTGKRPKDLDLLLHGERQGPDRRVRRHLEAGARDDAPVAIEQLASPDEAEPSRLGAEEDVLGDRPLRDHARPPGRPSRSRARALREASRSSPARRAGAARPGPAGTRPRRSCRAWTCRLRSRRRRRERSRRESPPRPRAGHECRRTTCRPRGCRGGPRREPWRRWPDWSARPLREREELVDVVLGDDAAVGQVGEDVDPGLDLTTGPDGVDEHLRAQSAFRGRSLHHGAVALARGDALERDGAAAVADELDLVRDDRRP